VEAIHQEPLEQKRTIRLAVEILAKANEDLDDILDDLSNEVEELLEAQPTLNGLVSNIELSDTEITLSQEGESPFGSCRMTYEVEYFS